MKIKFLSYNILKFIILILTFLIVSFVVYLYYYSIPKQVTVEINTIEQKNLPAEVFAESFLFNEKKFIKQADNKWLSQTGLIRSISLKLPDSIYSQLSNVKVFIGDAKIPIKNVISEHSENSSDYTIIEIKSLINTIGLINFDFKIMPFIRSVFYVLCFVAFIYAIALSIRLLRRKKQKEEISNATPYGIIPVRHLVFFSILILLIPLFVFIGGYLKIQYSLIIIAVLLITLYVFYKKIYLSNSESSSYSVKHIIIVAVITAVFIFLSGIGGLGLQNDDWVKHNYILSDLINHTWPVFYDYSYENSEVGGSALIYYTGFYMLPALFGKFFGWAIANVVMIIQSYIALFLIFCWVIYFAGNKKNVILVIFIFLIFSGADVIGHLLKFDTFLYFTDPFYTESLNIQYTSNILQLFWVPQHSFGAWLGMSLILYFIKDNKNFAIGIFVFAITVLWSVYTAIGFIPFIIFYGLKYFKINIKEYKRNIMIIISSVLILLIEILYFSSKSAKIEILHYGYDMDWLFLIISLCEFALIEWLLIFIIILLIQKDKKSVSFNLLFITALILFVIPLIPFVSVWDFIARSSLPALFVLAILLIKSLFNSSTLYKHKLAIILLLAIGIFAPINEVQRSINYLANGNFSFPPEISKKSTIPSLAPRYAVQYMGNENSFFFRYLCKTNKENLIKK